MAAARTPRTGRARWVVVTTFHHHVRVPKCAEAFVGHACMFMGALRSNAFCSRAPALLQRPCPLLTRCHRAVVLYLPLLAGWVLLSVEHCGSDGLPLPRRNLLEFDVAVHGSPMRGLSTWVRLNGPTFDLRSREI